MSTIDNTNPPSIKLNKVRLSYPSLFVRKIWPQKPGIAPTPPKFEATFILNKESNKKEIDAINNNIDELLKNLKVPRSKIKSDFMCFKDGDLSEREEYENSYTIKSSSLNNFPIVNKDGLTPVHAEDELFFGGCYVNAYISLWAFDGINPGISCNLKAIQFVSKGDAFGVLKFDISGKFESIEDEELF